MTHFNLNLIMLLTDVSTFLKYVYLVGPWR